jgi:hypothetical protein
VPVVLVGLMVVVVVEVELAWLAVDLVVQVVLVVVVASTLYPHNPVWLLTDNSIRRLMRRAGLT